MSWKKILGIAMVGAKTNKTTATPILTPNLSDKSGKSFLIFVKTYKM